MRATLRIAFIAGLALAACARGAQRVARTDSLDARRLDGSWHARLRIDRLRFNSIPPAVSATREATGTIALVANDWLGGDDPFRPSHFGSYSIDFSLVGIEPRHRGQIPQLIAGMHGRDSVEFVLEPEDDVERVVLHGAWHGDSIVGQWTLEPMRAGGDAAGVFTLTRSGQP